ncbi:L-threonylcarbamoyladenylate synthase [Cellulomonas bogoriensis]|nr:L-threonylcarbamoyladenylate synthase [Cellulomonas bogoriensis]
MDEAVNALARGGLVVLPTDTVYGLGADAFQPEAVAALASVRRRVPAVPPPVLVPDARTLDGLCTDVPDAVRDLVQAFWPGGLTVICRSQPSLAWDLGDAAGTVAVRVPDHAAALALLRRTGPLAVTGAHLSGSPATRNAQDAQDQLGPSVSVYLDAGPAPGTTPSTIVDATGGRLRVVRAGAVGLELLRTVADVEPVGEDT